MRIPEDWDRPRPAVAGTGVAASYYPPLRYSGVLDGAEKEAEQFLGQAPGKLGSCSGGGLGLTNGVHTNGYSAAHGGVERGRGVAHDLRNGARRDPDDGPLDARLVGSGPAPAADGRLWQHPVEHSRGRDGTTNGFSTFDTGPRDRYDANGSLLGASLPTPSTGSAARAFGGGPDRDPYDSRPLGGHEAYGGGFSAPSRPAAGGAGAATDVGLTRREENEYRSWRAPVDHRGFGSEEARAPSHPPLGRVTNVGGSTGGACAGGSAPSSAGPAAAEIGGGEVEVRGSGALRGAWRSWDEVEFPPRVRAPLVSAGFPAPTAIQQHAWPILTLGRDLIGIAKTGSGKTLAFLLPAFARLVDSRADLRGPPAVLVLAPTRELACQIEQEARQFGAAAGMRAACLYGGAPKGPQLAEMRARPQVLVATPGRLNDLLDPPLGLSVAVDVKSVQYLVLDEADRMLDMGFEPQIRKIIALLPRERQTVMFTATWPTSVRRLASEFLRDPVEVRVGEVDSLRVNPDVEQRVVFCLDMRDKEDRCLRLLREAGEDQAIVFVNTKRMCETVALRIDNSVAIHGDKDQRERDTALGYFKSGARRVMVATDVAARGLDIKSVRLVINFDPPNRDEDYVHRVGRTGRAGQKGVAVSLLTNEDGTAAAFIADILRKGGLAVPEELERRLASGELRQGGGRDPSRGPRRTLLGDAPRRSLGMRGNDPFGDDFDLDDFGGGRSSGFAGGRAAGPRGDFMNACSTDCPTY